MRNNRPDILVNSEAMIRLFDKGIQQNGPDSMVNGNEYKIAREAWVAAVYLKALRKIMGKSWWILVHPEENSEKDIVGYCYVDINDKRVDRWQLPIQVFTRGNTNDNTLADAYKRKLKHTDLKDTSLVCYANKNEQVDLVEVRRQISEMPNLRVRDVWLISNKPGFPRIKHVVQIYPELRDIEVDLDNNEQDPNPDNEPTFLTNTRGLKKGSKFEPLGRMIMLKPNFKFEE